MKLPPSLKTHITAARTAKMTVRVTKWLVALALATVAIDDATAACTNSITEASGTKTKPGPYCPGDLIFEDNFDTFDMTVWKHKIMKPFKNNGEFQYYVNSSRNSFVKDGKLHIHPIVSGDSVPEKKVESARIVSKKGMSCKFCRVKIRAKMPSSDWTWPAMWMLPKDNVYGYWPRSGEMDITEVRGNKELYIHKTNIGGEQTSSTLHFGPDPDHNGFPYTTNEKNCEPGNAYNMGFHVYELIWTENQIQFKVDDAIVLTVEPGSKTFWELGHLKNSGHKNPWRKGTKMAPFDQQFYITLNVAIGGEFFPDDAKGPKPKPWKDGSKHPLRDFFSAEQDWLPSWMEDDGHAPDLIVDYVRVYAL